MATELQLSDTEWELMKVLWDCAPASVNQSAERTKSTMEWHPKTVRTMLIRLHKKGIVEHVLIDNIQHYQPLYSREECSQHAAESFLDRVFDGALTPMVAHFTKRRHLTAEERDALERLLEVPPQENKE